MNPNFLSTNEYSPRSSLRFHSFDNESKNIFIPTDETPVRLRDTRRHTVETNKTHFSSPQCVDLSILEQEQLYINSLISGLKSGDTSFVAQAIEMIASLISHKSVLAHEFISSNGIDNLVTLFQAPLGPTLLSKMLDIFITCVRLNVPQIVEQVFLLLTNCFETDNEVIEFSLQPRTDWNATNIISCLTNTFERIFSVSPSQTRQPHHLTLFDVRDLYDLTEATLKCTKVLCSKIVQDTTRLHLIRPCCVFLRCSHHYLSSLSASTLLSLFKSIPEARNRTRRAIFNTRDSLLECPECPEEEIVLADLLESTTQVWARITSLVQLIANLTVCRQGCGAILNSGMDRVILSVAIDADLRVDELLRVLADGGHSQDVESYSSLLSPSDNLSEIDKDEEQLNSFTYSLFQSDEEDFGKIRAVVRSEIHHIIAQVLLAISNIAVEEDLCSALLTLTPRPSPMDVVSYHIPQFSLIDWLSHILIHHSRQVQIEVLVLAHNMIVVSAEVRHIVLDTSLFEDLMYTFGESLNGGSLASKLFHNLVVIALLLLRTAEEEIRSQPSDQKGENSNRFLQTLFKIGFVDKMNYANKSHVNPLWGNFLSEISSATETQFNCSAWADRWPEQSFFQDQFEVGNVGDDLTNTENGHPQPPEKAIRKKSDLSDDDDSEEDPFDMDNYDEEPDIAFTSFIPSSEDPYQNGPEYDEDDLAERLIKPTDDFVFVCKWKPPQDEPRKQSKSQKKKKAKMAKMSKKGASLQGKRDDDSDDISETEKLTADPDDCSVQMKRFSRKHKSLQFVYSIITPAPPLTVTYLGRRPTASGPTGELNTMSPIIGVGCFGYKTNAVLIYRVDVLGGILLANLPCLVYPRIKSKKRQSSKSMAAEQTPAVTSLSSSPLLPTLVATGQSDGISCIWDFQTQTLMGCFAPEQGPIESLVWVNYFDGQQPQGFSPLSKSTIAYAVNNSFYLCDFEASFCTNNQLQSIVNSDQTYPTMLPRAGFCLPQSEGDISSILFLPYSLPTKPNTPTKSTGVFLIGTKLGKIYLLPLSSFISSITPPTSTPNAIPLTQIQLVSNTDGTAVSSFCVSPCFNRLFLPPFSQERQNAIVASSNESGFVTIWEFAVSQSDPTRITLDAKETRQAYTQKPVFTLSASPHNGWMTATGPGAVCLIPTQEIAATLGFPSLS
ncbi:hypothetical protein BLNAU_17830 [Blattamonas nauphoetae]|uniref:Uncharacterized protein n=1 Tax=Blattamonas nauphoetae TaxID=2049346 RepID=A0ABQ9X693_9EUKA|nr:hypothetical protein BLNAU_17830 [Blattamonas nauphoetae]